MAQALLFLPCPEGRHTYLFPEEPGAPARTTPWAPAPPVVGGQSLALYGLEGKPTLLLLK